MIYAVITFFLAVVLVALLTVHRQRSLQMRAHLMQEAIRNRDFTFRLPTKGLLPGERAMQETLNQLGSIIHHQVSQNEVESWERLTRVLTHEIMNAMAPVSSISQSLLRRDDVVGTPLEEGIRAIHSTSHHLTNFVDTYRKLSQLQQPVMGIVSLASLVKEVVALYPALQWDCTVDDGITVSADPNMLRHILVNLTKNAVEANAKCMGIEATAEPVRLYVSNDGCSIPAEAQRNIFVPFFTTKRTGNGIGLSLSRRMMLQQGGMLELADAPHHGFHTTFVLMFGLYQ